MSDEASVPQKHPSRATDHLLGKMWKTKSARFNAHQRLMSRFWISTVSTSVLACYLIAASILQLTIEAAAMGELGKIITSAILITSVFLLMITLTESARNYPGEAEKMHRSALEIAELYNGFQALDLASADRQRVEYNNRYSAILKSIEVNHKDVDTIRFRISARGDFKFSKADFFLMLLLYCWYWLLEYALYIFIIAGPPVMFFGLLNRSGQVIAG